MRARYAGVCSKTGRRYNAGAEITKGSTGWELASAAAPAHEFVKIRRPDGAVVDVDLSRKLHCQQCGQTEAGLFVRDGSELRHGGCDRVLHILSDDEVYRETVLPHLHIEPDGTLSHKVGPAMWERVKQYFYYQSYADLAERLDDEDEFDRAEEYGRMRGGDWFLTASADRAAVEELLGILPENRGNQVEERRREQERRDAQEIREAQAKRAADYRDWIAAHTAGLVSTFIDPAPGATYAEAISFPRGTPGAHYDGEHWTAATVDGATIYRRYYTGGYDGEGIWQFWAPAGVVDEAIRRHYATLTAEKARDVLKHATDNAGCIRAVDCRRRTRSRRLRSRSGWTRKRNAPETVARKRPWSSIR